MIINKLQNYRNKSKSEMCRMIVERKKNENLDQIMYAKDFDGSDKDDDVDDSCNVEEDTTVEGMKTRRRNDCPRGQSVGKSPKMGHCTV
jgi:predicted CopG family antitoxin